MSWKWVSKAINPRNSLHSRPSVTLTDFTLASQPRTGRARPGKRGELLQAMDIVLTHSPKRGDVNYENNINFTVWY